MQFMLQEEMQVMLIGKKQYGHKPFKDLKLISAKI
jgi:hypothetical protein